MCAAAEVHKAVYGHLATRELCHQELATKKPPRHRTKKPPRHQETTSPPKHQQQIKAHA